jgi:putative transposase
LPVLGYIIIALLGCHSRSTKEGCSMATLPNYSDPCRSSFSGIAAAFLSRPGLPFFEVLSAERIERLFAKHGNLFGVGAIYSTAVMVWSFLGQVLRDGK